MNLAKISPSQCFTLPTKLVKQVVVTLCFKNALANSCHHSIHQSSLKQVDQLCATGYRVALYMSVTERIIRDLSAHKEPDLQMTGDKEKVTVLPYIHSVPLNLKRE